MSIAEDYTLLAKGATRASCTQAVLLLIHQVIVSG